MAKLQNYNGHYCESQYEYAFISFLENEGWYYLAGNNIPRSSKREVLYLDDMEQFLTKTNQDLQADEVRQIMDNVRLVGAETDFATLHRVYGWMIDGVQFTPQAGLPRMVNLIDFEHPENNLFRVVNQFTVEYINNGQKENRRPDVILFVNGMPLCVIELKNPADAHATIYDAWEQINIRYWRDNIPENDNWNGVFGKEPVRNEEIKTWLSKCSIMQMTAACCIGNAYHSLNMAFSMAKVLEQNPGESRRTAMANFSDLAAQGTGVAGMGSAFDIMQDFDTFELYYGIHLEEDGNIIS